MAKSISSEIRKYGTVSFSQGLIPARKYLLRRVGAIFPYLLISTLIAVIVRGLSGNWPISAAHVIWIPSDLMILQCFGFSAPSFIGVIWYLSASFFAIAVLYPIMRRYYDCYCRYFSLIIALLLVGVLQNNYGTLSKPNDFLLQIFNTGFIRSISMVSLGSFVFEVSEKVKTISFTKNGLRLLTALEIALYVGVFGYMTLWQSDYAKADSFIVLYMAFAVAITLSSKSFIYGKVDNGFVLFLGKLSAILYLNHHYWFTALKSLFEEPSIWMKLIAIVLSFITSLLVYVGGNCLIKIYPKIKKCFIIGSEKNS